MKRKKYFVFVGLSSLGAVTFLGGCSTILLFDPKGPIGEAERFVIIAAIVLMADRRHSRLHHGFLVSPKVQSFQYRIDLYAEMELFR